MITNIERLLAKVGAGIRDQCDVAVIGLSGGADSTLTAILCMKALGKENVYGLHLPFGETDLVSFNYRSVQLAEHLGIKDERIAIGAAVNVLSKEFNRVAPGGLSRLNQGNMRSRMRMVSLYAFNGLLAEQTGKRCRVVGTDNFSENYIAFFTKFGDGGVDFSPIINLFKSEVYQLLQYFIDNGTITEQLVDRKPSAGLWEGQTDEGELGHTYGDMEASIRRCLDGNMDPTNKTDVFVAGMNKTNAHKNRMPPSIDLTEFLDHGVER